ncbi:MAG: hypothetical protein K2N71_04505 [Oscillospiraceae bacterium]|nr:hypothetical protein [Oscillospiraceae bacterium]
MSDERKVNKTHKNVIGSGYIDKDGIYGIDFIGGIYGDCRDGFEIDKIVKNLLNPEEYDPCGGFTDMRGSFVKDNIRVVTWWTGLLDYFWEIDTYDETVQEKVYEWAGEVYDEYLRAKKSEFFGNTELEKKDESRFVRTHKNVVGFKLGFVEFRYAIAFDQCVYGDYRDGKEIEKILQQILNPEKYDKFDDRDNMDGGFVKDGIEVETWLTGLGDYFWQINISKYDDKEAVRKKVYDWACEVYDEYLKLNKH